MAVFPDVLGALESHVKGAPVLSALALAVFSVVALYNFLRSRRPDLSHIPILGAELGPDGRKAEYARNATAFLQRGYIEFNKQGQAFQVEASEGPVVVLNARQVDELRELPDSVVDNEEPIMRAKMEDYLRMGKADEVILRTIKTDLTSQLGALNGQLAEQTDMSISVLFPPCDDWTPVKVYEQLLAIVAGVSTRVFIGEDLAMDPEWIRTSIEYTVNVMTCATDLKKLSPWKRPFLYRTLPTYQATQANRAAARRLIQPIVRRRREAMEDPGHKGSNDMLQWVLDERVRRSAHDRDFEKLSDVQLELANAAIHTTSMALLNMLYDLVAMPEYQDIIREELQEALEKSGGEWDGVFLKGLQKTDSFMKESQRHEPVGLGSGLREIRRPVTLSDGTFLPVGTLTIGNAVGINNDPEVLLSDTDPNTFDGLRYYKMRERMSKDGLSQSEVAGKHQFVSVSTASLMFGYGRHACPGRFFAGNEIKLILVKLLQRFDIKSEEKDRPRSLRWEVTNTPDTSKAILMRRRRT